MIRYLLKRLMQGIAALLIASVVIFGLARLSGSPVSRMLPETASQEDYKNMAIYLGLDKPLPVQYLLYMSNLVRGDLGRSIRYRMPVIDFIIGRAPATLKLAGAAALFSILLSLPLGVLAAMKRDGWQDLIAKSFAILGQSIPAFWLGIMLIQVFSVNLGWLPSAGYRGGVQYWILPVVTLGYHCTAGVVRLTRSAMLDVLSIDFVRLARIKGVSERSVIWKHAFRNALIPVVTFSGLIYVNLLVGSVVTETIFAWPGIGRLAYDAVVFRDFPLMQGLILIFVGFYIVFNLIIDISYLYLDPRVRYVKE